MDHDAFDFHSIGTLRYSMFPRYLYCTYRYVYGIDRVNSGLEHIFYFDIVRMFTRLSIALTSAEILEFWNLTSRVEPFLKYWGLRL